MHAKKGEIIGIAGLMGSGRTELAMSIFGRAYGQRISGTVLKNGQEIDVSTIGKAIAHGLAYVTEDRKGLGLILEEDIQKNTSLANLDAISKHMVIDEQREFGVAEEFRRKLKTRCSSVAQKVVNLSGGNQQKVVLAKWLFSRPDILILDEPSRGIDVGAKYEIYSIISEFGRRRQMHHHDFLGNAGIAGHVRPDLCHERRPLRGRTERGRSIAGTHHARDRYTRRKQWTIN